MLASSSRNGAAFVRSILAFFGITFAASWGFWALAASVGRVGTSGEPAQIALATVLLLLGTFTPALVAITLTTLREGRGATERLLARIVRWDVGARWYVFAIALMPVVKLSAALVHRIALGAWPRFGAEPWRPMAAAILVSTWVQAGEEIGWRGYALPRLAQRFGLGPASLVLGVLWACWHLPLFFVAAGDTAGQSFPLYLMQVTALSVVLAWLYWRSGGSLLLVMLLHAAVNNTKDIVPSRVAGATDPWTLGASPIGWITVVLLWIVAVWCLARMRGATLPADAGATAVRTH